jgi:hypothetical protein
MYTHFCGWNKLYGLTSVLGPVNVSSWYFKIRKFTRSFPTSFHFKEKAISSNKAGSYHKWQHSRPAYKITRTGSSIALLIITFSSSAFFRKWIVPLHLFIFHDRERSAMCFLQWAVKYYYHIFFSYFSECIATHFNYCQCYFFQLLNFYCNLAAISLAIALSPLKVSMAVGIIWSGGSSKAIFITQKFHL